MPERAARIGEGSTCKRAGRRHARREARRRTPLGSEDEVVHVPLDRGDAEGRRAAVKGASKLVHVGGAAMARRV